VPIVQSACDHLSSNAYTPPPLPLALSPHFHSPIKARLDILNSCGTKSSSSPYPTSPMFSVGTATRTSAAVNGIRNTLTRVDKEAIYKDYRMGTSPTMKKGGGGGGDDEDDDEEEDHNTPHFAKQIKAKKHTSDRNIAGDSPGPDYYNTLASMHALELGGVPDRQKGVKLTQAKRFAPYKREDGTVVEHPFDAIQTQKLLSHHLQVKKRQHHHRKSTATTVTTASTDESSYQQQQTGMSKSRYTVGSPSKSDDSGQDLASTASP
jgi:hypothetical protein